MVAPLRFETSALPIYTLCYVFLQLYIMLLLIQYLLVHQYPTRQILKMPLLYRQIHHDLLRIPQAPHLICCKSLEYYV